MSRDRVEFPCEAEYVSLYGRLNRLNLYTGGLMCAKASAVALPSGYTVVGSETMPYPALEAWEHLGYAAEADQAVVASGLLGTALEGVRSHVLELDDRRTLVMTEDPASIGCLGDPMRVLSMCSEGDLPSELERVGAGKVTLRFPMDPKQYWKRRKELESPLTGTRKVHLFKGEGYMILEPITR